MTAMCVYSGDVPAPVLADVTTVHPSSHYADGAAAVPGLLRRRPPRRRRQRRHLRGRPAGPRARRLSPPSRPSLLDLSRLEFVDVAGARAIARWAGGLCDRGVPVEVRGASRAVPSDVAGAGPRRGGVRDVHGGPRVTVLEEMRPGFEHEAMFYRDDDDFLASLVPFVRDGLDRRRVDPRGAAARPPQAAPGRAGRRTPMTSASTRWRRSASTRRGSSAPGPTP